MTNYHIMFCVIDFKRDCYLVPKVCLDIRKLLSVAFQSLLKIVVIRSRSFECSRRLMHWLVVKTSPLIAAGW